MDWYFSHSLSEPDYKSPIRTKQAINKDYPPNSELDIGFGPKKYGLTVTEVKLQTPSSG